MQSPRRDNSNVCFRPACWRSLVGVLCAMVMMLGCQKSDIEPDQSTREVSPVTFLVSCDTNGWIVPCGCSTKQSGGLLRRGTLVEDLKRKDRVVVLDAGGASAGVSDYHRTKFEAILDGEKLMKIAAHNIGAAEAKFGAETLRKTQTERKIPFVSANVFDEEGNSVAQTFRLIERAGQTFAVTGVLDPSFQAGSLDVREPSQALLDLLDQLPTVDGIIVLAYLPREALLSLAKKMPEVDAFIGGPTGQTIAATQLGATLVMSATNKGKFVAQLTLDVAKSPRWSGEIVEVDDSWADDSAQTENLANFHRTLAAHDFVATQTGLTDQTLVRFDSSHAFVGNDACAKCHVADCTHFASTKHAVAWSTLQQKGSQVDPYCQQCHTTGYGAPGGFMSVSQSADRVNVGCESCHGPGQQHTADPTIRTLFAAKDQCLQCHDRENSPAFEYATYWQKIIHGAKVAMEGEPKIP